MKILFTGFKGKGNITNIIIEVLKKDFDTFLFTNSYNKIEEEVANLNIENYDS